MPNIIFRHKKDIIKLLILSAALVLLPMKTASADSNTRKLTYSYAKCNSATHYYWNTYLNRIRSDDRTQDWLTISREFNSLFMVEMIKVNPPYGLVAEGQGKESFYASIKTLEAFAPNKLKQYVKTQVDECMETYSTEIYERTNRY